MTTESKDLDCQQALEHMYEYLDEELTPELEARVREHLVACLPCQKLADFEQRYLRFLEARTKTRGAPAELRRKILERIITEDAEADCDQST